MKKVFIDGSAGTTGLRIRERLADRRDLELVILSDELRKDVSARRDALNACDIAFLCLPDVAAIEAVSLVENPATVVIDTSTAHRTNPNWAYGFPELTGKRAQIASARRIANPGCHASGFIGLIRPLVEAGLVSKTERFCAFSLTGYSGGGKKMISDYGEKFAAGADPAMRENYLGGRQYALGQTHKHLPEMAKVCELDFPPVFSPIVVPHVSGMEVSVQLHADVSPDRICECYRDYYSKGGVVKFAAEIPGNGFVSSAELTGRDDMVVSAFGAKGRIVLVSVFDNLGKGASGAAIQNMNIALGEAETKGLVC